MVRTEINGQWSLMLPEHRAARPEWDIANGGWERERLDAMHAVIRPGHVVWDVGAEEGDMSALFVLWGADVVLAEPNPLVWPNIRAIFEGNRLRNPLWCWPGFFADRARDPLHPGYGLWPESAYGPVIGDHGFCRVEERPDLLQTTIDATVAAGVPAPHVITMDVEGAEHLVLAGAAETLERYRPHVFVSVHPEFMHAHYGLPDGLGTVLELMAGCGYGDGQLLAVDHEQHWWWAP